MSEFASKLSDDFERVYVADLDGISKNKPQLDVAQEICEEVLTLYEGGVRFAQNVIDMLITGAERAVIGTANLASIDELRKAFMLSENITFKVDYRDGIVSFDPNIAGRAFLALSQEIRDIGVADIVVPEDLAVEASAARRELG
ncbi:MAG: HisA/HisF-related TIM barrel protein, partial [Thermoplasmata archaeon]